MWPGMLLHRDGQNLNGTRNCRISDDSVCHLGIVSSRQSFAVSVKLRGFELLAAVQSVSVSILPGSQRLGQNSREINDREVEH